jgi:hypothetical protein
MRTELWLWLWGLLLFACTDHVVNLANSVDRDAATNDASLDAALDGSRDASAADTMVPVTFDAGVAYCGGRRCQCSDGADNDGDGVADGLDPECTGPADDVERNFGTGLEQDPGPESCLDCFFEFRPGNREGCNRPRSCTIDDSVGNGKCRGNDECDVPASSPCITSCLPLVPNGCDCFGCCEVQGRDFSILLRDSCSMATIDQEALCPRCTQSDDCRNPCGTCEVCPGRTPAELPASCDPSARCGPLMPCEESADCEANGYCFQGCCFPFTDGV